VRQEIAEPPGIAPGRSVLALKRKIVVCAETLEPRIAFVPFTPAAQLVADILNLLPQQPRGTITTARLQLHDRCGYFNHARIEIDGAA
jgi:hypothetical protein